MTKFSSEFGTISLDNSNGNNMAKGELQSQLYRRNEMHRKAARAPDLNGPIRLFIHSSVRSWQKPHALHNTNSNNISMQFLRMCVRCFLNTVHAVVNVLDSQLSDLMCACQSTIWTQFIRLIELHYSNFSQTSRIKVQGSQR